MEGLNRETREIGEGKKQMEQARTAAAAEKDQSLTKAWRATPFHEKQAAPYLRAHSAALCYVTSSGDIRED